MDLGRVGITKASMIEMKVSICIQILILVIMIHVNHGASSGSSDGTIAGSVKDEQSDEIISQSGTIQHATNNVYIGHPFADDRIVSELNLLRQEIEHLKSLSTAPDLQTPTAAPSTNSTRTSGAVYVRWGRTTCPSVSEVTYEGIAGGKWYANKGGASNYLCLPEDPEYDVYQAGVNNNRDFIYSAEYQGDFLPYVDDDQYVPCVVCDTINRGRMLMIPAKMTCPSGWTKEYHGYLMAEWYDRPSTEYLCVDRNPEVVPGGAANDRGALLYPVEGRCDYGNLPCAPYINGAELTCVVCTK